jgi:hypothetical protein
MDTVNTTIDSHAVTKFVEPESLSEMKGTFSPVDIPSSEFASIAEFLARPVLQHNTYWETTDVAGHDLIATGLGLPSDGFLATNPMFVEKLKGYNLISATVNYRVQINNNPFQQGRLLAHFLPFGVEMGLSYRAMRNFNLTTKTQQPHIEIDCRDAGAVLSVPYLAPTTHYELHSGHCPVYERGRLHISVLSPLKTGATGTQDVEVAVWIYFTDVKLRGPIVPQSGVSAPSTTKKGKTRYRGSFMKDEVDTMMESKIVSKGLMSGSRVASALAMVPMLSEIAAPAAWVLGVASSVASSLGFSRPRVDIAPSPVTPVYDKYLACGDGTSSAVPLAMTSQNALSVAPYSYTDEDEMSFAYLNTVEALVDTFSVSTSNVHDSVVYTKLIGPSDLVVSTPRTVGTNTQNVITGPPFAYLSNKFLYWRGSIKLRLSLVRTEMQSGRIQVTFTPFSATSVTSPTVTTSSYSIREIVDLATDDDLLFEIPYMMPVMYLKTNQHMGVLQVRIVNTLRAPEATSASIDVLVFASAGTDFELAVPTNVDNINVQPLVPQSGLASGDEDMHAAAKADLVYAEHCVGERIMSTRQMLRFNTMAARVNAAPASNASTSSLCPWIFGHVTQTSDPTAPLSGEELTLDAMSFVAGMYALYRGGLEVVWICSTTADTAVSMHFEHGDGERPSKNVDIFDLGGVSATAYDGFAYKANNAGGGVCYRTSDSTRTMVLAQVPYYNRYPVSLLKPSNTSRPDGSCPEGALLLRYSATPALTVARRAAEDFGFSLFVGCPPWIKPTVS